MPRDDYAQRRPPIPREEIRGEGGMRPSGDLRGEPRRGGAGGTDPDPYDSAPNSARSSAYTDADDDSSLADFESGAEDLTDDEGLSTARELADDLAGVSIGETDRRDRGVVHVVGPRQQYRCAPISRIRRPTSAVSGFTLPRSLCSGVVSWPFTDDIPSEWPQAICDVPRATYGGR